MESGSWLDGEDNWLDAAVVSCPACGVRLFCMVHSPFCDDYRLHCDRCPRSVEISFYDPDFLRARGRLPEEHTYEQLMACIEAILKPCTCGGRFGASDLRRCIACGALVPEAAGKDVEPSHGHEDTAIQPTPDEQVEFDRFEAEFIRRKNIWLEFL